MENVGAGALLRPQPLPQTAKPRGRTVSGVCFNLGYLDLRRFCSTQRAVILPNVRMLNRAGEELSPVWGITPDACAVGAGVAVTAGRAVGAGVAGAAVAVLSAGAAVGATVGAAVGSAGLGVAGVGEGVGAFIPCAAFSAAPRGRSVTVLFLAVIAFQRFSSPAVS